MIVITTFSESRHPSNVVPFADNSLALPTIALIQQCKKIGCLVASSGLCISISWRYMYRSSLNCWVNDPQAFFYTALLDGYFRPEFLTATFMICHYNFFLALDTNIISLASSVYFVIV